MNAVSMKENVFKNKEPLAFEWLAVEHFKQGDEINWDYKWDPDWQVPYSTFNGVDMNEKQSNGGSPKNWYPWIYYKGNLMGADKLANLNWGFLGMIMGYSGPLLFNPLTTGGGDAEYIQIGVELANK